MVAAWSDSETSFSESDDEQVASVCLMAKEDDGKTEYESSYEVDISTLDECSKEELINALINFANLEQKYLSKNKDIKKSVRELTQKNLALEKQNNDLNNKIEILDCLLYTSPSPRD